MRWHEAALGAAARGPGRGSGACCGPLVHSEEWVRRRSPCSRSMRAGSLSSVWRTDPREEWLAEVEDDPTLSARASSPDEAARRAWAAIEASYDQPVADAVDGSSRPTPTHSGKLLVRMPATLHDELARTAESEGVSLKSADHRCAGEFRRVAVPGQARCRRRRPFGSSDENRARREFRRRVARRRGGALAPADGLGRLTRGAASFGAARPSRSRQEILNV